MQSSSTQPSTADAITGRQRWTLLIVAVAGHALKHLFNSSFFVILPEIKTALALSNSQVGALSTIRNVAGGLTNLPAGFAADRYAKRRPVIMGMSIALIGTFCAFLGIATNFGVATLAATLMIVAITLWHPSAISSLSQRFESRRGFAIALHGTGGSVGEALGPILTGTLITVLAWRTVLHASIVPAVAVGFIVWLLLRSIPLGESSLPSMKAYLGSVSRLVRNRRFLLVLLLAGGFSGTQNVIMTFFPIYLRENLGASSVKLGLYLSLAQVAGIGCQPIMGHLSDRLGRRAVLAPGLAILGLSALGLSIAPAGWPLVVVVLIMGAFLFSLMSILLASAMDLVPGGVQATTVSLVFGAGVVVSGLMPAVAGILADAYGVKAAFLWASGIAMLSALVAATTQWQREPAEK